MEDDIDDVNNIYPNLIELLRDTGQKVIGRTIGDMQNKESYNY